MKTSLSPTIAFLAFATAVFGDPHETEIKFADLPAPVRQTARMVVGPGRVTGAVRESGNDGSVIYEVSYVWGKKKFDAEISADGKLLVLDEEIPLSAAPVAVRATIEKATVGGKIAKVEKAVKGDTVFYEIEFRRNGRAQELKVDSDGRLLGIGNSNSVFHHRVLYRGASGWSIA